MDFDDSVLSTARRAKGTAVGFKKTKKRQRRYYPLFCTAAQTDLTPNVYHRPANVHDYNGAKAGILLTIRLNSSPRPLWAQKEICIDSTIFRKTPDEALEKRGGVFMISISFDRFNLLDALIEGRKRRDRLTATLN